MGGPTFDNRKLTSMSGALSVSKKLGPSRRAAWRRRAMPGYPIKTTFQTPEDVWEYLNGDRITCLRCGKPYKAIGAHIRIHGWTEERYREFYGLPWGTGLSSSNTKKLQRNNGLRLYEDGIAFGGEPGGAQLDKAHAAPRRKRAPYLNVVATMNVRKTPTMNWALIDAGELRIWRDADYWRILDRMKEQDRNPADVSSDPDMPSISLVSVFARAHPDFLRAKEEAWEALSFKTQAKGQHLGKRFFEEATKLRQEGMTNKEIARKFGVHLLSVAKRLGGVSIPEKTHCKRGHPLPAEGSKRCRICAAEMTRKLRGHIPRAESAKVQITMACSFCGNPVKRSRLYGGRGKRKVRCRECFLAYHREYDRMVRANA